MADAPTAAASGSKAELPDFEQLLNGEGGSDARFEVQEYDIQPKKMVHASVSQKDSFDANKSLIKVRVMVIGMVFVCLFVYLFDIVNAFANRISGEHHGRSELILLTHYNSWNFAVPFVT